VSEDKNKLLVLNLINAVLITFYIVFLVVFGSTIAEFFAGLGLDYFSLMAVFFAILLGPLFAIIVPFRIYIRRIKAKMPVEDKVEVKKEYCNVCGNKLDDFGYCSNCKGYPT
jgi:hypothetical protein